MQKFIYYWQNVSLIKLVQITLMSSLIQILAITDRLSFQIAFYNLLMIMTYFMLNIVTR